ncbi:MAG: flavin reductase [Chloroflexi bacterium]|nr:flavin reductase [Chloroflexota bacterium]
MREPPTGDQFRLVMGTFATGVTIITSAGGDLARAMTANSMTSVSLDPPSVLVCVSQARLLHGVMASSRTFCVNVLRADQERLARACAQTGSRETLLEGVPYRVGRNGAPIIEGVLAYVECVVAASLDFGTHTIFVGEAVGFGAEQGEPLLFYRGRYTRLPA